MKITVAICTWNRADLLDKTLAEMTKLHVPSGVEWQLLVVNNNSSDDTPVVIERYRATLPIIPLFEPKQGHCNSRNCALANATGDLLVWTDDDVLVPPDWLARYADAARAWPTATYFGGPILPWFPNTPPNWVRTHWTKLSVAWAVLEQRQTSGPLREGECVFGANMAFRTEIAKQFPYDPALGRKGNQLTGGDEIATIDKMRAQGHTGVWVGNAPVRHYIPSQRLTVSYISEYYRCQSRQLYQPPATPDSSPRLFGVPRWLWRKYWTARLRSWLLAPFRSAAWLQATLETSRFLGIIDRYRSAAKAA